MRLKPFTMENTKIIYYKIETTGLNEIYDNLEIISIAAIGDNTSESFVQKGYIDFTSRFYEIVFLTVYKVLSCYCRNFCNFKTCTI